MKERNRSGHVKVSALCAGGEMPVSESYSQFVRMASQHRGLINQVDQKVGREKAVMRRYIARLAQRLARHPRSAEFYRRWRDEGGHS